MDTDNQTAKVAAQELDHEAAKQFAPDTDRLEGIATGEASSENFKASIEQTTEKTNERNANVEAAQADDVSPPAVKVPRLQRRGLFGRFTLLAEVTEPKHYSRGIKWWITFVVGLAAIAAPMGSAIILRMSFFSPSDMLSMAKAR